MSKRLNWLKVEVTRRLLENSRAKRQFSNGAMRKRVQDNVALNSRNPRFHSHPGSNASAQSRKPFLMRQRVVIGHTLNAVCT